MPVAGESRIRLRLPLDGSRFAATRPIRYRIERQLFEQIGKELATEPRTPGLRQCLRETASPRQRPGEAETVAPNAVVTRTLKHEAADEVVQENVLPQLTLRQMWKTLPSAPRRKHLSKKTLGTN